LECEGGLLSRNGKCGQNRAHPAIGLAAGERLWSESPLDFKKGPALGQVATQRTNSELLTTFSYSPFPPIRQGFDREKERCEQIQ